MAYLRKRVVGAALGMILGIPGLASAAGKYPVAQASRVHFTVLTIPAAGATIETLNLSSGGDTVLHVQNPAGTFLAGNHDFNGSVRSSVTIGASASSRSVYVLVRSYSSNAVGTATLRFSPVGGTVQDTSINFGGEIIGVPN